jgi:hypothetical protein
MSNNFCGPGFYGWDTDVMYLDAMTQVVVFCRN